MVIGIIGLMSAMFVHVLCSLQLFLNLFSTFCLLFIIEILYDSILFYLFIFSQRGRERERNINVWLLLMHPPTEGPGLQPRHVP